MPRAPKAARAKEEDRRAAMTLPQREAEEARRREAARLERVRDSLCMKMMTEKGFAALRKEAKVIYDKGEIMRRAWACVKKHGMTLSKALEWSWGVARKEARDFILEKLV